VFLKGNLLVVFLIFLGTALFAAAPPVSNRAPAENDIGYLPPDGSTVRTNPPALAWLPERDADAYAVQLARDRAFTNDVRTVLRTPYVLYTHTEILAPGTWWWRYACLDVRGNRSAWSQKRRFTIAPNAQTFPRPSDDLVRRRLPEKHPRLMIRPEDVPMLREARLGAQKARWDELVQAAEECLKAPLIAEPPLWTDGKWNAEEWRRNFIQASKAADISQTLAFCYLLSGGTSRHAQARRDD
jgi:hypothetical protein